MMKSTTVSVHEAKTNLSRLVARAERGERITIARAGKAVAQLCPIRSERRRSRSTPDPLLQTDEYAFDGPIGKLTNQDIDETVYGS